LRWGYGWVCSIEIMSRISWKGTVNIVSWISDSFANTVE
jgi:hypothetical protein